MGSGHSICMPCLRFITPVHRPSSHWWYGLYTIMYHSPWCAIAPSFHLTISQLFFTPQPRPSWASASLLLTSTPAACEPEEPLHSFVARSMLTPSALSAAGNQMRCADICTPRLSPSFKTWLPPCSRIAIHSPPWGSSTTSNGLMSPSPQTPTTNCFPLPPTLVGGPPVALWRIGATIAQP